MNYEEFAADLPLSNAIEFTSEEESEEALRRMGIEQPLRQIGAGQFRYRFGTRSTAEAELFADRFSTAVSLHLEAPAGTVGMLFPRTASGYFLASGEQVGDRSLIVLPNGSGVDVVGADLVGSEAIIIPRLRFVEMMEVLRPAPQSVRPEAMAIIAGDTAELHALRSRVRDFTAGYARDSDPEYVANLVAMTIQWIGRYSPGWKPERIFGNAASGRLARLVRDYLEEHYCQTVRLEDLCRATGFSVRTVQRCFRKYFGMTITEYLRTVRLDTARRELLGERPSATSVAAVALRHGNTHLGRFSLGYRARFGEPPSETLATEYRGLEKLSGSCQ